MAGSSVRENGWSGRKLLERLGVSVYPGEGRDALLLFFSFFLCVTFQYAAKTVRQSTFIDSLGSTRLPYVYLLVALVSYPVARLYSHLAARTTRYRLVVGTYWVVALGLTAFWWLYQYPWPWVAALFYVWISIAIALTLSQLWSFASDVFDSRQAKRLFGFLGAGALLGGVAGGMVAKFAAQLTETRDSLLAAAALLVGAILLLYKLHARAPEARPTSSSPRTKPATETGFETVRRSQQLRLIAGLMLAVVVVSQVVDLQFNWVVEETVSGLANRTAFYGNFFSVMGVAAFLFQLLLTTRIHRLLGVGFALRVLPVSMTAGTMALFMVAAMAPGALVAVALGLKLTEAGLRYSLDDSTRELLFLPVPAADRIKAKTFLDVFVKRAAKGIAAILLFPVTLNWLEPLQAGWLSLAVIIVWFVLTSKTTREYVRSFRHGLRQTTVDSGTPINLSDVTTLEILVQSLGSPDPRQVLHSLELLAAHDRGHLVPPLLLYHDDAEVRQRTLQILSAEGRDDAAPLIERRLADLDPEVRAEATRVLAVLRHQDACDMMLPRLKSGDPGVRAAAIACLTNHGDDTMREQAAAALNDMLSDADRDLRAEGARAIGAIDEPHFAGNLVQMLYDADPEVVRTTVRGIQRRASRDEPNPLYLPTLISLLANRRLKHDVREALVAFGEKSIPALLLFMNDPDEPNWVRRAIPKTIARIDSPAAPAALIDSLGKPTDGFLRHKMLEALDSLAPEIDDAAALKIRREIDFEARHYLLALADLTALNPVAASAVDCCRPPERGDIDQPALLELLLSERAAVLRRHLFFLLALLYDRGPIWDAYAGVERASSRANALEFLDYTLTGEEHDSVLSAIGDAPLADKLDRAERRFGVARASRMSTLHRYMSPQPDIGSDLQYLAIGAMYTVFAEGITDLYPVVESLCATADDPFVLETANWVNARTRDFPQGPQP